MAESGSRLIGFGGIVIGLTLALLTVRCEGALSVNLGVLSPSGRITEFGYLVTIAPESDEVRAGDFFRIYDFAGYVPGSIIIPSGWTASVSLTDSPPPGTALLYGDDPTLVNLTFTYTGAAPILGGSSGQIIGPFDAESLGASLAPPAMTSKDFVASITNAIYPSGGLNGPTFVSEGTVAVPAPVPEPASLGLLTLATPLLLIRRRAA